MQILITGAGGMLAQALVEQFGGRHDLLTFSSSELDVTDVGQVGETLDLYRPDWVIHAAAFTDVDGAESARRQVHRVNAMGAGLVARKCGELDCGMLFFSTDYVFDGSSSRPYLEWDPICPINEYGLSKAAGEMLVRALCPRHLVVRTSWLFGPGGANFVTRILALAQERPSLQVISDQYGRPTYTHDLAAASRTLVEKDRRGFYHITNAGECSWHQFARRILELQQSDCTISPVPTSAFPTPAARPVYSVLDNAAWTTDGEPATRTWEEALQDYLSLESAPS